MNIKLIIFLVYTIFFESIIWGLFGFAVFIQGYSGWWIVAAIFCSAMQFKPRDFGIIESGKGL